MHSEQDLRGLLSRFNLDSRYYDSIVMYLNLLKARDESTYEHSIRVGILSYLIAQQADSKVPPEGLFLAGLFA